MITALFWGEELIRVDTLERNEAFTQGDLIDFVLSDLKKDAQNLRKRKHPIELAVHMDNGCCHNGQKVVEKNRRNHMIRLDHSPHSPDLSLCYFWSFGVLKNGMKETEFGNADEVEEFFCNFWSEVR
jgi:hypothetical protein